MILTNHLVGVQRGFQYVGSERRSALYYKTKGFSLFANRLRKKHEWPDPCTV